MGLLTKQYNIDLNLLGPPMCAANSPAMLTQRVQSKFLSSLSSESLSLLHSKRRDYIPGIALPALLFHKEPAKGKKCP